MIAAAFRDRLHRCHMVNIRGNSHRLRQRGDLAQALRQAPLEKEPRTRTDRRRGGTTVKQKSRRARIPGRSLRDNRARPSRQSPSENPASNTKRVKFSAPIAVQFSKPIDTQPSAEPINQQSRDPRARFPQIPLSDPFRACKKVKSPCLGATLFPLGLLAGFEKVPVLGGQKSPTRLWKNRQRGDCPRVHLGLIDGPGPEQGAAPQRGEKRCTRYRSGCCSARCCKGGMSKAATGRDLGISHRTATRWAATGGAGRGSEALTYGPRAAVPSILDRYQEIVRILPTGGQRSNSPPRFLSVSGTRSRWQEGGSRCWFGAAPPTRPPRCNGGSRNTAPGDYGPDSVRPSSSCCRRRPSRR